MNWQGPSLVIIYWVALCYSFLWHFYSICGICVLKEGPIRALCSNICHCVSTEFISVPNIGKVNCQTIPIVIFDDILSVRFRVFCWSYKEIQILPNIGLVIQFLFLNKCKFLAIASPGILIALRRARHVLSCFIRWRIKMKSENRTFMVSSFVQISF